MQGLLLGNEAETSFANAVWGGGLQRQRETKRKLKSRVGTRSQEEGRWKRGEGLKKVTCGLERGRMLGRGQRLS